MSSIYLLSNLILRISNAALAFREIYLKLLFCVNEERQLQDLPACRIHLFLKQPCYVDLGIF